jgi:hypothetical protein
MRAPECRPAPAPARAASEGRAAGIGHSGCGGARNKKAPRVAGLKWREGGQYSGHPYISWGLGGPQTCLIKRAQRTGVARAAECSLRCQGGLPRDGPTPGRARPTASAQRTGTRPRCAQIVHGGPHVRPGTALPRSGRRPGAGLGAARAGPEALSQWATGAAAGRRAPQREARGARRGRTGVLSVGMGIRYMQPQLPVQGWRPLLLPKTTRGGARCRGAEAAVPRARPRGRGSPRTWGNRGAVHATAGGHAPKANGGLAGKCEISSWAKDCQADHTALMRKGRAAGGGKGALSWVTGPHAPAQAACCSVRGRCHVDRRRRRGEGVTVPCGASRIDRGAVAQKGAVARGSSAAGAPLKGSFVGCQREGAQPRGAWSGRVAPWRVEWEGCPVARGVGGLPRGAWSGRVATWAGGK